MYLSELEVDIGGRDTKWTFFLLGFTSILLTVWRVLRVPFHRAGLQ